MAEETGGNPLFTLELLRHLVEQREGGDGFDDVAVLPLPDSVRDVVERRVARLGPATTELLQQAAVVGMSFDLDVLASTVDADADEVLDTLERARQAHLVDETDVSGRFSFTHASVAQRCWSRASRRPAWSVSTSASPRRSRSCTERSPART